MRRLEKIVISTWGDKAKDWLSALPSIIESLSKSWSLTNIHPADNLSYNYVALALQDNKTPVALKIGCDKEVILSEYNALKHFDGHSSVKVFNIDKKLNALLLEQAKPGYLLKQHPPKQIKQTIKIYAEIVKGIATRPLPEGHYKHAREWCEAIDNIKDQRIKKYLIDKAKTLKSYLLDSIENEHLCHGDLHLENIIQQGSTWLSIDPKGIVGEIAFEAATFNLLTREERKENQDIRSKIINRVTLLSHELDIETERLLSWFFLRNMISAQWLIEDNRDPKRVLFLLSYLYSLLEKPMSEMKNVCQTYEKISDWYDQHRSCNLFEQAYLDKAISLIDPHSTILDLGCGTGKPIAQYFLEKGFKVTGVDGSLQQIAKAKKNIPEATLIADDMRSLHLEEKFDCIMAWHSFFHLTRDEQRATFQIFEKHIKPNGILLFTSGPEDGEVWSDNGGEMLYHASLDPEEYKTLLDAHHFKVLYYKANDSQCQGANVWMAQAK